jgi:ATP-dependent protease HslVU (ClpYQ) peptidase subunit
MSPPRTATASVNRVLRIHGKDLAVDEDVHEIGSGTEYDRRARRAPMKAISTVRVQISKRIAGPATMSIP